MDKCKKCGEPISMQDSITAKVISDTTIYHMDCFLCDHCSVYMGDMKFFKLSSGEVVCEECKNNASKAGGSGERRPGYQIKVPKGLGGG